MFSRNTPLSNQQQCRFSAMHAVVCFSVLVALALLQTIPYLVDDGARASLIAAGAERDQEWKREMVRYAQSRHGPPKPKSDGPPTAHSHSAARLLVTNARRGLDTGGSHWPSYFDRAGSVDVEESATVGAKRYDVTRAADDARFNAAVTRAVNNVRYIAADDAPSWQEKQNETGETAYSAYMGEPKNARGSYAGSRITR